LATKVVSPSGLHSPELVVSPSGLHSPELVVSPSGLHSPELVVKPNTNNKRLNLLVLGLGD